VTALHRYPAGKALFLTLRLHATAGPRYLRRRDIAQVVVDTIRKGERLGHYHLSAYCVMPDHVQLLIWPRIVPARLTQWLKGSTTRGANCILERSGEPFWHKDLMLHWVRDAADLDKIGKSIENNAVRTGLAREPAEFPWSSASAQLATSATA
jgi:REP element-mobilizing transposase RayT